MRSYQHHFHFSILVDKLPMKTESQLAELACSRLFMRIALLLLLSWIVGPTGPVLTLSGYGVRGAT